MYRRSPISFLFVLALLLGQWVALAHDFEHSMLADDPACAICVHAQQLGGALGGTPPVLPEPAVLATAALPLVDGLTRSGTASSYDSRGPPRAA